MRLNRKLTGIIAGSVAIALVTTGCTKKNDAATPRRAGGRPPPRPAPPPPRPVRTPRSETSAAAPAPDSSGENYKVAFVPKLQGVPYFEAMNTGGAEGRRGARQLEWLYQGPVAADAAEQADIVRSFIQQGVDTLIVAPNDPDSMAPILPGGQGQGHPRRHRRHRRPELGA